MKAYKWAGVRVRHIATKLSFVETAGVADGGFVAPAGTQPIGHDLPVTLPVCLPFKRLLHSESCPMIETGFSALCGTPHKADYVDRTIMRNGDCGYAPNDDMPGMTRISDST